MSNNTPNYLCQNLRNTKINLSPDNSFELSGEIVCGCGASCFLLYESKEILTTEMKEHRKKYKEVVDELIKKSPHGCTAYTVRNENGRRIIGYSKSMDNFIPFKDITDSYKAIFEKGSPIPAIITAKCKCGKEILIFDSSKHGYDGLISELKYSDNYIMQKKSACRQCKGDTYNVHIKINHSGKHDVISQAEPAINEDNWTEAFGWVVIDLECSTCGKTSKSWMSLETM